MAEAPAAPAPSTGAPATEAQPATGTAPESTAPARKPLAPIRTLPGVFPDGDPFPAPPETPADPPSAAASPQRGPDGRFVAATSTDTSAGEHARERADAPAEPAKPAATAAPFKFAGKDYESQAAAEQAHRTLQGQFKPVQQLARTLGGIDKVVPQFTAAAESARAWKAHAESLQAELDAARTGHQPAKAADADVPAAEADAPVDWELYAEVKKLATESGEPWKAEQWLIEQTQKAADARWQKRLDERLAPLDQQQEQAATAARTETLFTSMAGMVDAAGAPAFPELSDETAAYEVGRLWANLGLPREAALTPQGAMAAIGLYRLARQGTSQAKTAAVATPQAPVVPPVPTDTQSAAGLTDGRPTVVNAPNGVGPSAEAARILAGLRQVNKGSRSTLGFDA